MKIKFFTVVAMVLFANATLAQDPYIGEVRSFGFNFVPVGWLKCNGQTLLISGNTALFSILGTTYGGNGSTTFMLPNLNGNMVVGVGQGPNLSNYTLGENSGSTTVTLATNNLPTHNHNAPIKVSNLDATSATPTGTSAIATSKQVVNGNNRNVLKFGATTTSTAIRTMQTTSAGTGTAVNITQPILATNFCIAIAGIFPQRP